MLIRENHAIIRQWTICTPAARKKASKELSRRPCYQKAAPAAWPRFADRLPFCRNTGRYHRKTCTSHCAFMATPILPRLPRNAKKSSIAAKSAAFRSCPDRPAGCRAAPPGYCGWNWSAQHPWPVCTNCNSEGKKSRSAGFAPMSPCCEYDAALLPNRLPVPLKNWNNLKSKALRCCARNCWQTEHATKSSDVSDCRNRGKDSCSGGVPSGRAAAGSLFHPWPIPLP